MLKLRHGRRTWVAGGLTLSAVISIITWPAPMLLFDHTPLTSIRIYGNGMLNRPTRLDWIEGITDESRICGIGPYDSFLDARFSRTLSQENQAAAEAITRVITTSSRDQTQIVVFTKDAVSTVFRSSVFQFTRTTKAGDAGVDCVTSLETGTPTVSVQNGFLISF